MQRRLRSRSPSASPCPPRMPVPGAVDGGRSTGSSPTARSVLVLALVAFLAAELVAVDELTLVGAAKVDVTPELPVVLAGYAARTTAHEGVDGKLWARALAFGSELPVVVIAVDNTGVPASVIERVSGRLEASVGLSADRLVVCSTHTHTAPNLDGYAPIIWRDRLSEEQARHATQYTRWLVDRLVEVAEAALESRRPARLSFGRGRVTFGGNRRVLTKGSWRGFGFEVRGPVDHSLPALVARAEDGRPFAIWTSYACHCTTLGSRNRVGGDWAGFASEFLETAHPGAVALTTVGCGADVGPLPSGGLAEARDHGREIADEVQRLLSSGLQPLVGRPEVKSRILALPLAEIPTEEEFEQRVLGGGFPATHARWMLEQLARGAKLDAHVDLPVTTWTFGRDLAVVFLAGEVVVDYSVRLDRELDWTRLWINGWSDDVPCYIPSRRVLDEGGYEADASMIYYAQPARFAPAVEDLIVGAVTEMLGAAFRSPPGQGPSPYHVHPYVDPRQAGAPPELGEEARAALDARVEDLLRQLRSGETGLSFDEVRAARGRAVDGFAALESNDGSDDLWFDFTGTQRYRPYVRQLEAGDTIRWSTAPIPAGPRGEPVTVVFTGGLGWVSSPETAGYTLLMGDEPVLRFDVVRRPTAFSSEDGSVRLLYLPTWTSPEDSGGFFFLSADRSRTVAGRPLSLAVRSLGSGSRRWFAVDPYTSPVDLMDEFLVGFE